MQAEVIVKQLELENALSLSAPMESLSPKDLTAEDVKELNGQGKVVTALLQPEGIICPLIEVASDTQLKNSPDE